MIRILFGLDQEKNIQSVELSGHAGYGEEGYDIVCAAVSSQAISVENSLSGLLGIEVETVVNEVEGGYLQLTLPYIPQKALRHDAQLLMQHLQFALQIIAENYPEYVTITKKNL